MHINALSMLFILDKQSKNNIPQKGNFFLIMPGKTNLLPLFYKLKNTR